MKPIVSTKWLSEHLNHPDLVILDVSLETNVANIEVEFPNLQIKGARFFDLKGKFSDKENPLPNTLPNPKVFAAECQKLGINNESIMVVYDNIGTYASPRVWWMFKSMGHQNIAVLDGGLPEWINKGNPTEAIKKQPFKKGDFRATLHTEFNKDASEIIENIKTKKALVIDARSKERFYGLKPESRENLKSGHIPNSKNLPFLEVLDNGKFLSEEKLSTVFNKLGATNQPLIFTCGSGLTACILILASEITGNKNNYLYDGSWTEWGQFDDFLIEK